MNTIALSLSLCASLLFASGAPSVPDATPGISLVESIEKVAAFLKGKPPSRYTDKYLSSVSIRYIESVPKKGRAWVHVYSRRQPGLGGDISIYHYMDGSIVEFAHGP